MVNIRRALVVGAGVSGLSMGLELLRNGFSNVEVWSNAEPLATTSAVAPAAFHPFLTEGDDRMIGWLKESYKRFTQLLIEDGSGVMRSKGKMVYPYLLDENPAWHGFVSGYRRLCAFELNDGEQDGFEYHSLVIEMGTYLTWLIDHFRNLGGKIFANRHVDCLYEAAHSFDLVVNCSGLGARELASDHTVYGARGQLILLDKPDAISSGFYMDEKGIDGKGPCYVIPRREDVVLGTTFEEGVEERIVNQELMDALRMRCLRIEPGLAKAREIARPVGVRPMRREGPRLEVTQRGEFLEVHNYGHGPAGVTLSWGCAVDLVGQILRI